MCSYWVEYTVGACKVHFGLNSKVFALIFCLGDLSIGDSRVWNSPTIIVLGSICPLITKNHFIYETACRDIQCRCLLFLPHLDGLFLLSIERHCPFWLILVWSVFCPDTKYNKTCLLSGSICLKTHTVFHSFTLHPCLSLSVRSISFMHQINQATLMSFVLDNWDHQQLALILKGM